MRPVFVTMSLDTIPLYEGLTLPGCEYYGGRLCSLSAFVSIITAGIQASATGPVTDQ